MRKKAVLGLICTSVLFFSFLFFPNTTPKIVYSQNSDSNVTIGLFPENPGPNEEVTLTAQSYSLDLNKAQIIWSHQNKVLSSGVGKKSFIFKTAGIGTVTTIDVTIRTLDGETINKKVVIEPVSLDLLWEAVDSYTPPFYKGKALPSKEATIKTVAFPSSRSSAKYTYYWNRGGKSFLNDSGYGKNSFVFGGDYLNSSENITVRAEPSDGTPIIQRSLNVTKISPEIAIYERDLLLGVLYNRNVEDSFEISDREVLLHAEPYFATTNYARDPSINYEWLINGQIIEPDQNRKNNIVLKKEKGAGGKASLKLTVTNIATFFEETTKNIKILLD